MGLGGKPLNLKWLSSDKGEKQDNKSRSQRHEKALEKKLRAKVQPNSGALPHIGLKGDLKSGQFVWQAKLVKGSRFVLDEGMLLELWRQSALTGRIPGFEITFEGLAPHLPAEWIMVPISAFDDIVGDSGGSTRSDS